MAFLASLVGGAMHRGPLLAALATALLLAGCTGSPAAGDKARPSNTLPGETCLQDCQSPTQQPPTLTGQPAEDRMTIRGVVMDRAMHPLTNATVHIQELDRTQPVSASGTFLFEGLVPMPYLLVASAPEFRPFSLTVTPTEAKETIKFELEALPTNVPYHDEPVHFHGHIQCALEVLIITPACDTILTAEPLSQDPVLNGTFSTQLPVGLNWKTVVVDVVFDPAKQPGTDGLRTTVRGTFDSHQLGTYVDYAQFIGAEPFQFRIEPGAAYEGGDNAVPSNTTQFQFDTYPQSKGWHTVCTPFCTLGVGAGLDVEFDLYMTVFYVEPAPESWSIAEA